MDVSVIIVNWNTAQVTCDCLESVYQQTTGVEFEAIVIDNASSDDSIAMFKESFPQVILIENSDNRGFAAANNQGMAIARGRYILLLNSDTVVLENAIEKTVRFADSRSDAAVIGCRVLNPDRSLQPTCFMYPSVLNMVLSSSYLYKVFPNSKFFGRERMSWWDRNDVRDVEVVTGCFMLVRREAMQQVGMMDERFFMYGEEADWCYRFKQSGWRVIFMPDAQIIHLGGASSNQIKPAMKMQLSAGLLQFVKKQKGFLSYAFACVLTSLFFALRIPYWLVKSLFSCDRGNCLQAMKTYLIASLKSLCGWKALSFRKGEYQHSVLTSTVVKL